MPELSKLQSDRITTTAYPAEKVLFRPARDIVRILDRAIFSTTNNNPKILEKILFSERVSNLREALLLLNKEQKKKVFTHFDEMTLQRLISISGESNSHLFWQRLYAFGWDQYKNGKNEIAAAVFHSIPKNLISLHEKARNLLAVLQGYGKVSDQAEHFSLRFFPSVFSPSMILPITLSSIVGAGATTLALNRLAFGSGFSRFLPTFLQSGLGARITAGGFSLLHEVPTYVATNIGVRYLLKESYPTTLKQFAVESVGAASTIGMLKFTGYLGNQFFLSTFKFNELNLPHLNKLQRFAQWFFPQSNLFVGLATIHQIEQSLQLRPETSSLTNLLGTLHSVTTLGIGSKVGQWAAGNKIATIQKQWGMQAGIYRNILEMKFLPTVPQPQHAMAMGNVGTPQSPFLIFSSALKTSANTKKDLTPIPGAANTPEKVLDVYERYPMIFDPLWPSYDMTEHERARELHQVLRTIKKYDDRIFDQSLRRHFSKAYQSPEPMSIVIREILEENIKWHYSFKSALRDYYFGGVETRHRFLDYRSPKLSKEEMKSVLSLLMTLTNPPDIGFSGSPYFYHLALVLFPEKFGHRPPVKATDLMASMPRNPKFFPASEPATLPKQLRDYQDRRGEQEIWAKLNRHLSSRDLEDPTFLREFFDMVDLHGFREKPLRIDLIDPLSHQKRDLLTIILESVEKNSEELKFKPPKIRLVNQEMLGAEGDGIVLKLRSVEEFDVLKNAHDERMRGVRLVKIIQGW